MSKIIFHIPLTTEFFKNIKNRPLQGLYFDDIKKSVDSDEIILEEFVKQEKKEQKKSNVIVNGILYCKELQDILIGFTYDNKTQTWPRKSSIYCFWCCHPFDNPPCFIPVNYKNENFKNIFYVYGNFCSFNCTKSYIIDTRENNWNKNLELLNFLYRKLYKRDEQIINAPHKKLLKIFGGYMTIEEFRSTFNKNINYNIIYPNMVSLIPQIECEVPIKEIIDDNVEQKKLQEFLTKKTSIKYKQTSIF